MKKIPFTITRTFHAPVHVVWEAITDKGKMKQWYFDFEAFQPVIGFEFQFYGGTETKRYLHLCQVTEVVPDKKLTYGWKYKGFPGASFVTFELFAKGDKTNLRLTHKGLGSFPADNPDFARESFAGGWTHIIGVSLKFFLENG